MKARTFLQDLSCQINWSKTHALQTFRMPLKLDASPNTEQLVKDYHEVMENLRVSLEADYQVQKKRIITKRKEK